MIHVHYFQLKELISGFTTFVNAGDEKVKDEPYTLLEEKLAPFVKYYNALAWWKMYTNTALLYRIAINIFSYHCCFQIGFQ